MTDEGFSQTLHGLLRKRGELARDVTAARKALDDKLSALDTIDAAIRIFNPNIAPSELPEARPIALAPAGKSEFQRFLLDHLRRAGGAVTTVQACAAVMEARKLDQRDRVLSILIRKRTGDALGRLRSSGLVESAKLGSGAELAWRLVG